MFGSRSETESVTCIACGDRLPRSEAREYDKHGDRWDRRDKSFEFLCKGCFTETCHQPRDGLEATLTAADAGETDRESFLEQYLSLADGDTTGE